jgi:4-alpha-glucanotransferase
VSERRPSQPSADAYGVQTTWLDSSDAERHATPEAVEAMHRLIGEPPVDLEDRAAIVTRPGRSVPTGTVHCEDGRTLEVDGALPSDFPLGYHRLRTMTGTERVLIVSPGRCWQPMTGRAWGWAVQLYAVRSAGSQGIGDLADLRTLRDWAQELGAGFLMINPLHAVAPTLPQESSPYLPVTRRWRNPLYLRVDDLPPGPERDLIDRDEVWQTKRAALVAEFAAGPHAGFDTWREVQGESLSSYATWAALAQEHGPDWQAWPTEFRDPSSPAVEAYARERADEIGFHAWLQWRLDAQLREASGDLTIVQDLPIGVDGGGADAWARQDILASGASVGAPPDRLSTAGQDWGSPPMVPWKLRMTGYDAFVQAVRATIAGAGGLRIDHVMGLFRLWWVPEGGTPLDGLYVRYPSADLLDIVALESHRAQALVVGEDLGTVEPGVREALAEHGILSYRVLWFEEDEPASWPAESMATVTTHDLPTVAGAWSGADAHAQHEARLGSLVELEASLAELLAQVPGTYDSKVDAVLAAYRRLAQAPSRLLCATLEDAVASERRPNMPGTTIPTNWSVPLPLAEVLESPVARDLAGMLAQAVSVSGSDGS